MIYLKPASLTKYLPQYIKPFIGFAAVWLIASFIGDKYNIHKFKKLINLFYSIIRVDFIVVGMVLVAMYAFGRFEYSRLIVFGTIALSTVLEMFFGIIVYTTLKQKNGFDNPVKFSLKPKNIEVEEPTFEIIDIFSDQPENINESIYHNLKDRYLRSRSEIFNFLADNLPIKKLRKDKSLVLDTNTFFNFEYIDPETQHFFFNLHKVNDYRRINRYFIQINNNLLTGGYFVGCGQTIKERHNYFFSTFPKPIAYLLHMCDSFWKRVIPKLQGFKQIYFYLTKGNNRALSKAEILGRLFYCGFNIIAIDEFDNKLYFIAQKVSEPKEDINPSYGPFIKMKRVGKNNEILNIYKFRTMHPYSEYLQAFIYKENELESGGKLKDDFRITSWGKFFRKWWIDELPQFINFFRGELSLVGVRALSFHYFSLYPKDLQELRTQFKPGLVPPYYVDLPNSFEEIIESERRYLLKRQKRPFSTQIEYFFKAWWNIIVRRARSK